MRRLAIIVAVIAVLTAANAFAFGIWRTGGESGEELWLPTNGGIRPTPGDPPVDYHWSLETAGTPDVVDELLAVQTSFATWEAVSDSAFSASPPFFIEDGGIGFAQFGDGFNSLAWIETGWFSDPGALAITINDFDNTGKISEGDIYFNGESFSWSTDGNPSGNTYDIQSVATHEIGHLLGLDDLYNFHFSDSTMFGIILNGETSKRDLELDDEDAIRYLYPVTENSYPNPSVYFHGIKLQADADFVSSIVAGNAPSTAIIDFAIKGFGFIGLGQDGFTPFEVHLREGGSPTNMVSEPVTSQTFVDPYRINFSADMTNLAAGPYDVVVKNPNGDEGTLFSSVFLNQTGNVRPVLNPISAPQVTPGTTVVMQGTATDPLDDSDGNGALIYSWTLSVKPQGSAAALTNANTPTPSFLADVVGYYVLDVTVSDGILDSVAKTVTVLADTAPPPPPPGGGGGLGRAASSGGGGGGGGCMAIGNNSKAAQHPMMPVIYMVMLMLPLIVSKMMKRRRALNLA